MEDSEDIDRVMLEIAAEMDVMEINLATLADLNSQMADRLKRVSDMVCKKEPVVADPRVFEWRYPIGASTTLASVIMASTPSC